MIRDPFYRAIEERLGGRLDPELFEQCAADLLRTIHPTLVPIRGGNDAGMDGAIADHGGLPFPLVTTTATNVIGNLRRNLKSYLADGGARKAVVLATSQALTLRRRRNLEQGATQLGFTLNQIHDRAAFADLLYRSPEWCRELLDLTGVPPTLSVLPRPTRPLIGDVLVGRSEEMQWLVNTEGDLLLVGQPGAGKTFLLHHFAKSSDGLFVLTSDPGEIADGLRSQQPSALVVDDAHLQLTLLVELRRIRTELGIDFRIIADSWPGSQDEVARALEVTTGSVRTLELLSRDDIAQIVKEAGIGGPRALIREIIDQAEGKPGLAVTLVNLCLRGDVSALAQGDALAQEVGSVFRQVVGEDVMPFLAAFATGGQVGMTLQAVADYFTVPLHRVRELAAQLAAGGVLVEVNRESLAVRPPALRHVLVRDVFFSGAMALPIDPLVNAAPDIDEIAATVIGAQYRGAQVPADLTRSLVANCRSSEVWASFARLGRHQAEWIASNHPEWLVRVGYACLDIAPDLGLPPLFEASVGDERALHSHPDHAMRVISDWVTEAYPGTPAVIERREHVLLAAERWFDQGGDPAVGVHGLGLSLSPEFSRVESDVGGGRTFTFTHGLVTVDDARAIRAQWQRVRERVTTVEPEYWTPLRRIVEAWAYHGPSRHPLPKELTDEAEAFASEMLRDLAFIAREHPGFLHWAQRICGRLDVELGVPLDPAFEILFPARELDDWREAEVEQRERVLLLAEEWASQGPEDIVENIIRCEREAGLTSHAWPRWTPTVCGRIAELVSEPADWLHELLQGGAAHDLIQPFLVRVLESKSDLEGSVARLCLADEKQRLATATTLLASDATPSDLVEVALTHLQGGEDWIQTACLRGNFPEAVVSRLLTHQDAMIASAAAIGEWHADRKGDIRVSLRGEWEQAILRTPPDEWLMRDILKEEPGLAVQWLTIMFEENRELWRHEEVIDLALHGMDEEQRRHLLAVLPSSIFPVVIVRQLIGDSLALYRELLQSERLKAVHLAPLIGYPDISSWSVRAEEALAAGYTTRAIAEAAFGEGWSWSGNVSEMWDEWANRFTDLVSHANEQIGEIGHIGTEIAIDRRDREAGRERTEEVRGR